MIVLYETTNVIEVFILQKPTCLGWNNGNAVLGIQNLPGTVAYTPPGRNTGNWDAFVEAWQFLPTDGVNDDPFADGSKSMSIAGFIEGGYTHSFNHLFAVYGTIGLGYGESVIEDFAPALSYGEDRTRLDPFFLER